MKTENLSDSVIFLLGAGISADADVPISSALNKKVRNVLSTKYPEQTSLQQKLMNFLVGSVYFHRGLTNTNPESGSVNIEEVLSSLQSLKNRKTQQLSAFVGNWHNFLSDYSDAFLEEYEKSLREIVVDSLKGDPSKMGYIDWFKNLHQRHNSTINIFTLNQDTVLETALKDYGYVNGFDGDGNWNPELFDGVENEGGNAINLFKLHGSLGWKRNENDLIICDSMINVSDKHLMIFGILDKVTLEEPYFELIKRFKELSRKVPLIVTIGYSFSDAHINNILFESLRVTRNKRILVVDMDSNKLRVRLQKKYSNTANMSLFEYFGDGIGAGELLKGTKR